HVTARDDQGTVREVEIDCSFFALVRALDRAGYYSGILAYNPRHHSGGKEFRTYGNPGVHFKVVYPVKLVPMPITGDPVISFPSDPCVSLITDIHIDDPNPVGTSFGDKLKHGWDFLKKFF